jgi:hypothetical protein
LAKIPDVAAIAMVKTATSAVCLFDKRLLPDCIVERSFNNYCAVRLFFDLNQFHDCAMSRVSVAPGAGGLRKEPGPVAAQYPTQAASDSNNGPMLGIPKCDGRNKLAARGGKQRPGQSPQRTKAAGSGGRA